MEYRVILDDGEVASLSKRLIFLETGFIKDVYTGVKRIRTDLEGTKEKDYETPVKGTSFRFSARCKLDEAEVWFEYKWTDKKSRFEMEFEGKVPKEFLGRQNIPGWDILR